MKPAAPPLRTWALAAVLAGAFLAIVAVDPAGRANPAIDLNLARLNKPRTPDTPLVVILGTSKVQCAVGFDPEITARVRANGAMVDVVRLTRQGASYRDLEPAFERLAAARPTLVLVEEDLLLFNHPWEPAPEDISWRARADRAIRIRLGLRRIRFNYPGANSRPCRSSPGDPKTLVGDYLRGWAVQRASTPESRGEYLGWINLLRANGSRVALINIPRSPLATQVFPATLQKGADETLTELQTVDHIDRIAPRSEIPQSAFSDLGHMNAEGRRLYMDWLAPTIAGLSRHE